jgi:hypothetical protein
VIKYVIFYQEYYNIIEDLRSEEKLSILQQILYKVDKNIKDNVIIKFNISKIIYYYKLIFYLT